jgi:hypothetical protein
MTLPILGAIFGLAFALCSAFILVYAFGRSVGTGFIVLLIPGYILYFAFRQFEHRHKAWIVCGWMASMGLAAVFFALAQGAARAAAPLLMPR